jgi:hypothetical protein
VSTNGPGFARLHSAAAMFLDDRVLVRWQFRQRPVRRRLDRRDDDRSIDMPPDEAAQLARRLLRAVESLKFG